MASARVVMRMCLPDEVVQRIAEEHGCITEDDVEIAVAEAVAEDPAIYQHYADPMVEVDVML